MTPVFSWLHSWRRDQLQGTLQDIFIVEKKEAPMRRVEQVEAGMIRVGDAVIVIEK